MKKTSLYTIVTVAVIAAGTAFIAHSLHQDNRSFLGRITGGATDVAAAAVDLPEDVITGNRPSLDQRDRGVLGTVVGGAGDVAAAGVDVPQNVVQGNYRRDRRYEDDSLETEMVTDEDIVNEEIFPSGQAIEEEDED